MGGERDRELLISLELTVDLISNLSLVRSLVRSSKGEPSRSSRVEARRGVLHQFSCRLRRGELGESSTMAASRIGRVFSEFNSPPRKHSLRIRPLHHA